VLLAERTPTVKVSWRPKENVRAVHEQVTVFY
jgi:hypothetical protein